MTDLMTPTYAKNMRIIGHTDQGGGRADGVQMMVHKGHAFVAHVFSKGFSVIDVRDPTKPTPVNYIATPPNTWSIHLQQFDDLLLVIHAKDMFAQAELADERNYYKGKIGDHGDAPTEQTWSAGMAVYDVSKPEAPRQIGFMPVSGGGLHRLWYVGGRWAYASALLNGFSDYILDHHRYGGSDQAGAGGKVLAARNERRSRGSGALAERGRSLRASPCDRA